MSNEATRRRDCDAFEIAIFCALGLEADAMLGLFDEIWEQDERFEKTDGDMNSYTIGRIGQHNVVLVHMPRMGTVSASTVAANLRSSFPRVRLGLLVGICGAVPVTRDKREILLGDVIISTHLVQSDFGRLYPHTFVRRNLLQESFGRPSPEIAGFLSKLQGKAARHGLREQIQLNLANILSSPDFALSKYPGIQEDKLLEATYRHMHHDAKACAAGICSEDNVCPQALELSCAALGCDLGNLVPRTRILNMVKTKSGPPSYCPEVHFGGLASGNQVIKSALHRDSIAEQEGVIAFEMEGGGMWDTIPTIVVKSACDYADSHKNKRWQQYAAVTAAACAKGMLVSWTKTAKPVQGHSREKEFVASPAPTQVFDGNFTAGKNIHNGGTYTAESITF